MASFSSASIPIMSPDSSSVPAMVGLPAGSSPSISSKSIAGLMTLPEGRVVSIQQGQQGMVSPRMMVPVGMAFSSIVGALLQSRQSPNHEFERVVGEPFHLLARRVVKAEWPEGTNPFTKGDSRVPAKKKKKKKKRPSQTISALFDSIDFFQHAPVPSDVDLNYEDLGIMPVGDNLTEEAKRLDKLREIASDVALFCSGERENDVDVIE